MSLRPLFRHATTLNAARGMATSAPRRAAHSDHHGAEDQSDTHTNESFFTPSWRNAFIILTASILIYPYLPSPSNKPASPSLDPEAFAAARKDEALPALTRWLAKQTEKAEVWAQRNEKHLELTKEAAETKLLFQEGERPKVLRMRYPSSFEQASPHSIAVGSQADLSDLKVRPAQ
ncbi:hypothetical protein C343_06211 [Cryptococcus neoformans C23]|uniref:Uncharacterized protein n=2 Tax=Cryptococcus neoformans TaxID=5207 RepID=A0A854Q2U5_CRYNE|nr:hypothetical protein CNAG_05997 [Cryptococcus neoformans var. grubii H99]AUB28351.1 hypothetical protein CKF44_05997 [Cryptococcus neoformans var. grubii]OWZ27371.1 hypothetical protein C347_06211 [Cryptococcus neoformans var. grubii AD2-60a]OWZ29943.1 hypothetical protein C353_06230 [Cryptococcus neoformans var. grubii AD1-83a]OWZ39432.1 hypothetical protein C343_06211 [Cryptococcus neoformans var. grubii C23]OWZ78033.1 hypothetical protein C365_03792 [Cryptococcus neoformans var. grubii B|eukprot:XP_012053075.1 hypothetical protein CNAG_05997 [Cryptococcus neoformans var. grubii H99]